MPLLVGDVDRPGQGRHQLRARRRRPGARRQLLGQAAALQVLQREVGPAVVLADLVDLARCSGAAAGPPPAASRLEPGPLLRIGAGGAHESS